LSADLTDRIPAWCWAAPLAAALFLALKFAGLVPESNPVVLAIAAVLLGAAVFAAVHHAEVLAAKVGEPFGSILHAFAVTII
jgi:Ca2+:H+ antiporter